MRGLHEIGDNLGSLPGRAVANERANALRLASAIVVVVLFSLGNVMDLWAVIWSTLLMALLFTLIEIWRGSGSVVEVVEVDVLVID